MLRTSIACVLVLAGCARGLPLPSEEADGGGAAAPNPPPPATQDGLQKDIRAQFIDRAMLLRQILIDASAGASTDAAITRTNQVDPSQSLRVYYGDAVLPLQQLFKDEALDMRDIGAAVLARDAVALQAASLRLKTRAQSMAVTLSAASQTFASAGPLFDNRANDLASEGTARLAVDFAADIAAHDRAMQDTRAIADLSSQALATDFPDSVTPGGPNPVADRVQLALRTVTEDRTTWMRMLSLSIGQKLPDTTETMNRVMRNATDIGNTFATYYGGPSGSHMTLLFATHGVKTFDAIAAPSDENARALAYSSGDNVASYMVTLDPALSSVDLTGMFRSDVDSVVYQAGQREDFDAAEKNRQTWVTWSDTVGGSIAVQIGRQIP
jgi:hypothetical protein